MYFNWCLGGGCLEWLLGLGASAGLWGIFTGSVTSLRGHDAFRFVSHSIISSSTLVHRTLAGFLQDLLTEFVDTTRYLIIRWLTLRQEFIRIILLFTQKMSNTKQPSAAQKHRTFELHRQEHSHYIVPQQMWSTNHVDKSPRGGHGSGRHPHTAVQFSNWESKRQHKC